MHLEDLADTFLLVLSCVEHLSTGLCLTRVNAGVGETTEERVNGNLERKCCERLGCIRLTLENLFLITHVVALCCGNVEWAGEVVNNSVKHGLNTTVLERRTTEHRVDLRSDYHLADGLLDLGYREVGVAFHVTLEELVVTFSNSFNELCAVFVCLLDEVRRDLFDVVLGTHFHVTLCVSTPGECTHLYQVNNTFEGVLETDRKLDNKWLSAQTLDDGVYGEVEVSTQLVHLVNEADTRNVVLVSLTPYGLRLRLNTFFTIEHSNSTVENAERTLHLHGEVNVTGGVNDVDLVLVPETGGSSRSNRDTTLLLLCHPVHG